MQNQISGVQWGALIVIEETKIFTGFENGSSCDTERLPKPCIVYHETSRCSNHRTCLLLFRISWGDLAFRKTSICFQVHSLELDFSGCHFCFFNLDSWTMTWPVLFSSEKLLLLFPSLIKKNNTNQIWNNVRFSKWNLNCFSSSYYFF